MPDIDELVNRYKAEMIKTMSDIIAIPAIAPSSGGKGESKRADFVERKLDALGLHVRRFDYKDETGTVRSNLVAKHGNSKSTIWILSHLDTVSPGDLSLWHHDPFDAYVESGKLYGRGSSDNGQGIISSLFAAKALLESKANTRYNIGLAFVAD
ncbi:MAG: M20/M25/M40 family metallo-hydrolase, partial [Candidatus Micrarchaeia archaeon]